MKNYPIQIELLDAHDETLDAKTEPRLATMRGVPADLVAGLVFGRLAIPLPKMAPPTTILWGDYEIALGSGIIELDGYAMVVSAEVPFNLGEARISYRGERACTLTLADGSQVVGKGHLSKRGMSASQEGPASRRFEFRIYEWDWQPESDSTLLLARIEGLPRILCENVCVEEESRISCEHFRGEGHAIWHVVTTPDGHAVLIERQNATAQQLRFDLRALEFVFGRDVSLTTLWKVDASGQTLGGLDLARPGPVTNRSRFPVPWSPLVRECWGAALFKHVARRLPDDKALEVALAGYMDSLSGHIHSAYLLAQVALEASCRKWHKPASSTLVRDPKQWTRWVESKSSEIEPFAIGAEAGMLLVKKIKSGAIQGPSSEIVNSAFEALGVTLDDSLRAEIVRRNGAAHEYLMFDEDEENLDLEVPVARLNMVQFLLAAMISLRCGYTGALAGWSKDNTGHLEPASSWPVNHPPEALLRYIYVPGWVKESSSRKASQRMEK